MTIVHRCREQTDQCRHPDGRRCTDAVARPVMNRHAYACEVCGREYRALDAWQFEELVN